MARRLFPVWLAVGVTGCNLLLGNESGTPAAETDAATGQADAAIIDSGPPTVPAAGEGFDLLVRYSGLPHVGAISDRDFRLWRGGLAVADTNLVWLESGSTPALAWGDRAEGTRVSSIPLTRPGALRSTKLVTGDLWFANAASIQTLRWGSTAPILVATAKDDITNLACDGATCFWTAGGESVIHRKAVTETTVSDFVSDQETVVSLSLGASTLYWFAMSNEIAGTLRAIRTNGSESTPRTIAAVSGSPRVVGASANYVYYALKQQVRRRLTDPAATVDELVADDAQDPWDIVVNDVYAYWIERGNSIAEGSGRLRRVSHGSTTPTTLAVGLSTPVALALEGTTVYVALGGTSQAGYLDGSIIRVTPKN